jgi:hypothetical protein
LAVIQILAGHGFRAHKKGYSYARDDQDTENGNFDSLLPVSLWLLAPEDAKIRGMPPLVTKRPIWFATIAFCGDQERFKLQS